ncbi:MAG: SO2930 family diheme c-type cytochrome, partial [Bacteroidota bacterium]
KLRFVKLPDGEPVPFNDQEVLHFPVGTTIIKTFYFPNDARKPQKGRRLMETRLLIHEEAGWKALPYHWDEDQAEATLEVAGDVKEVKWVNEDGKKFKFDYVMPNMNQCKGCHSHQGKLRPIGPSARQLNGDLAYADGTRNQLAHWHQQGMIANLPEQAAEIPRIAIWDDPTSGTLDERARAWLDINCAHCHNANGPASTSGLWLDIHETNPTTFGVYKNPVAAGRGAGEHLYDIHPGKPEASILVYRMESEDPGVMMPELGRGLVHEEGVALIQEWISQMPASAPEGK